MTNPPLDLLKYRAFSDVAEAMRLRIARILQRFQQVVKQVLPAAEELTLSQLVNSLPGVLQQITEALESDEPAATFELLDISQPHGEIRFHQNYNVNELLIEYHLIRRIVIEEVIDALGRPLGAEESVALNLGIDTALRRGVVAFVDSQTLHLREINDLQSRYLSFLSHDLRGGLNGTLLMVEVLKRELSGPGQSQSLEDLEVMRRSILETVSTLDRFLYAERLRKGDVHASPSRVDVAALLRDAIHQVNFIVVEKGLTLNFGAPASVQIVSDLELLKMLVESLLDNAVKFSRKGEVSITVNCGRPDSAGSAAHAAQMTAGSVTFGAAQVEPPPAETAYPTVNERSAESGEASLDISARPQSDSRHGRGRGAPIDSSITCTITITDQGPGIPPEKLSSLFNPVRETEGRKSRGLGLMIARQSAELLGARITINSEVGKGTTVIIVLPGMLPPTSPRV